MAKSKGKGKVTCCGNIFPFGKACPSCGTQYGAGGSQPQAHRGKPRKQEFRVYPKTMEYVRQVVIVVCVTVIVVVLILASGGGG